MATLLVPGTFLMVQLQEADQIFAQAVGAADAEGATDASGMAGKLEFGRLVPSPSPMESDEVAQAVRAEDGRTASAGSPCECRKHVQSADDEKRIVAVIERVRVGCGISVAELARRVRSDRKRLWYVLNGKRRMRVGEFLRLCTALRIDPRSFITRDMVDGALSFTRRNDSK